MSLDTTLPRPRRAGAAPRARRALRIPAKALLVLTALIAVAAGGWLWLRDSSLAAVRTVEITGSTSSEEPRVIAALDAAARDMTTLHVRRSALEQATAQFTSVAGLRVQADFPHTLRIEVLEHRPVAALDVDGRRIAAAGSGLLLSGVVADRDLPVIHMDAPPAGDHVENAHTLTALAIAAAAPKPLSRRVERLYTGPEGMMLNLRDGPDLIFGDATGARRKWLSAARVLADPSAAGATYLDVRVPERVAAGGLGPVAEATPSATTQVNPLP